MYCPNCGSINEDSAPSCSKCNANLRTNHNDIDNSHYAGFWVRLIAASVDVMVISIIVYGFSSFINRLFYEDFYLFYGTLLSILIAIVYHAHLESSVSQATIGKQVLGIKVMDLEGNRISFKKALDMYIVKITVGILPIVGQIPIVSSKKKQSIHDMAAGTVVVFKQVS